MLLTHIRGLRVLPLVSLVLVIQFAVCPSYVYAGHEASFEPASGNYQRFKSAGGPPSDSGDDIPNPAAAWVETQLFSIAAVPTGSITIEEGDYTNDPNVNLILEVFGDGTEPQLQADGNGDGTVDAADYVVWRKNSGTSGPAGDYDQNGFVDEGDFNLWRSEFGRTETASAFDMRFSEDSMNTWTDWEDFQPTKTWTFSAGDDWKTIFVQYRDANDPQDESAFYYASIFLDTIPPQGQDPFIMISGGAEFTLSTTVNLFLSAVDLADDGVSGGSGVESVRFSEDGGATWGNWQDYATFDYTYTFSDTTNGLKEIQVRFRDFAQNESLVYSDTITLDTVPPALDVQEGATYFTNEGVRKTVILGPAQDQEGDDLFYAFVSFDQNLNDNGVLEMTGGNSRQLTYLPNDGFIGSGEVTIQAYDFSSGEETQVTFTIEVKAPTPSYSADPYFQYSLDSAHTRAIRAWSLSRGAGVTVAVLDTGVDLAHVDLDGNIFMNFDELMNGVNGVDDDNNGFVDDFNGWDFYDNDNDPSPSTLPLNDGAHGTHVAGIVAAERNETGTAGIAPESNILPVKVLNPLGSVQDLIAGINYAVAMGVKIINMSLAALRSVIGWELEQLLQAAIDAAYQAGVVLVAAAGNDFGQSASNYAPAGLDNVISVSSTTPSDTRASSSNINADISAPGSGIQSTYWPNDYSSLSGTSMATPLVAGLVALLFSQNPDATLDNIWMRLQLSAEDLGTQGWDSDFGYGRIDAFKALTYDYYDDWTTIKTQWLEEPDENGYVRLDFDQNGFFTGGLTGAGAGAFAGIGSSMADTLVNFFSAPDSASEAPLEHMPRIVASPPFYSPVAAASLLARASRDSQFRTPLNWSALGPRGQNHLEAKDERKEKKSDQFRFSKSKRSGRR